MSHAPTVSATDAPPRIAVLPSTVADQIAAGEVVERPSSVIKELIENSLDAGAATIEVEADEGGRARIRVSDDGTGMGRDDALLSLERHATSKIRLASDLVGVRSYGFRGEALAAIASVSRLELETSLRDGEGTAVSASGGRVDSVRSIARRRGTSVTVSQLFYNAPARLKFMKGARSEWRAIMDVFANLALTQRSARLSLRHDGRDVAALPSAASLRDRLAALYGPGFADRLLGVEDLQGTTHVSGLVERPGDVGTTTRRVFVSVNGRVVRDLGLLRAAESAYRSTIPAGVRPTLFVELVVAADAVDVNVHPAKAEVRFRDRWPLERLVENAVRRALGAFDAAPALSRAAWPTPRPPEPTPVDREALRPAAPAPMFQAESPAEALPAEAMAETEPDIDVPPLVQLKRTYIMFEHEQGVVLIDQHSAHERVLYERFMRALECRAEAGQRLLFPMTLHLSAAEAEAFEVNRAWFEGLGFEIEGFGGQTLIIRSVPMPHPRFDAERCVRETLAAITGDRQAGTPAGHERLASTVACKAAIKAGDALTGAEMRQLFIDLRQTTLPAHDVHGRSTIVQLGWDELERRFGRR